MRKQNKHKSQRCEIAGKKFHSKGEGQRYLTLMAMQEAGLISNLRCQVRYKLAINNELICHYVADFTYVDQNKQTIVEDYKNPYLSKMDYAYKLKKKLMKAIHGINIIETFK